jgi:hypothetical protein
MIRKPIFPLTLIVLLVSLTLMSILVSSAYAQTSQILIEGADSTLNFGLQKSDDLNRQAANLSPRILVEYADSILSLNLERPTAMLPTTSQPPATVTTSVGTTSGLATTPSSPTTTKPELKPGQPYVDLYGHKTTVSVGEEIIIYLSAVNPITSSGTLVVQLTLRIPSGWSITSSGFGQIVGGMSTNTYEIQQGPNTQAIEVHILANEAFKGNVTGYMDYYFKDQVSKYHTEANLPVTASLVPPSTKSVTQPSSQAGETDNKGLSGTMIAIIIGICTATAGGVLARVIYGRMKASVPVTNGISDELSPSPKIEQPNIQKETKDITPLVPISVSEDKPAPISLAQKGTNQDIQEQITKYLSKGIVDKLSANVLDPLIQAEKKFQTKEDTDRAIGEFYDAANACLQQYFVFKIIPRLKKQQGYTEQQFYKFSFGFYRCKDILINIDEPEPEKIKTEEQLFKSRWPIIRNATLQTFPNLDRPKLKILAEHLLEIQRIRNRLVHDESDLEKGPRTWQEQRTDLVTMRYLVLGPGQNTSVIVEIMEIFGK